MIVEISLIIALVFLFVWIKHQVHVHEYGSDITTVPFNLFEIVYRLNPTSYQLNAFSAVYTSPGRSTNHTTIQFSISDTFKYIWWKFQVKRGKIDIDPKKAVADFDQALKNLQEVLDKEM